jgi:hypothetical protein
VLDAANAPIAEIEANTKAMIVAMIVLLDTTFINISNLLSLLVTA